MMYEPQHDDGHLKVIGAGVGRTGTLSLLVALEILGHTPLHMQRIVEDGLDSVDMWREILLLRVKQARKAGYAQRRPNTLTKEEWVQVLKNYDATLDFPSCMFFAELKEYFPHAKVILTVRDPESWYSSICCTLASVHFDWKFKYFLHVMSKLLPSFRRLYLMLSYDFWRAWAFEEIGRGKDVVNALEDKELMMKLFGWHNESVKSRIQPNDLLIFHPKQGWGPLCTFLNLPIPDEPFPNINSRGNFPNTFNGIMPLYLKNCIDRDGFVRVLVFLFYVFAVLVMSLLYLMPRLQESSSPFAG